MLEAVPSDFFCKSFFLTDAEKLVGEVDTSVFREKARLELEDGSYRLFREGGWRGDFLMELSGKIVARATKPSFLQSRFEVQLGNQTLVLRRLSLFGRRYGVFENDKQIGSIYRTGLFTRRSHIDLPTQLPMAMRGFLFWLVVLMWKREQAATA